MLAPTSRIYLGIDPSLTSAGIAFVGPNLSLAYVIQPKNIKEGARLKYHLDSFRELVRNMGDITAACIEGPAYHAVNRSEDMGQIRGAYSYALADLCIPTTTVPPSSLKAFATGNGSARKTKMIQAAQKEWPEITLKTDDMADALWLAAMARALYEDVPVTIEQIAAIRGIRNSKPHTKIRLNRKNNI